MIQNRQDLEIIKTIKNKDRSLNLLSLLIKELKNNDIK